MVEARGQEAPPKNQWVTVTGEWAEPTKRADGDVAALTVTGVQNVTPPANQYEYRPDTSRRHARCICMKRAGERDVLRFATPAVLISDPESGRLHTDSPRFRRAGGGVNRPYSGVGSPSAEGKVTSSS